MTEREMSRHVYLEAEIADMYYAIADIVGPHKVITISE